MLVPYYGSETDLELSTEQRCRLKELSGLMYVSIPIRLMLLSSQTLRSALIQQCFSRYCKRTPDERSTSTVERKHYKIVLNHHFNLVPNKVEVMVENGFTMFICLQNPKPAASLFLLLYILKPNQLHRKTVSVR